MKLAGESRRSHAERGSAAIELAFCAPILILVFLGVTELSRAFQVSMTLEQETAAAAFEAALSSEASQARDPLAADGLRVDQFCACPGAEASGPDDPAAVSCAQDACGDYGRPRRYVRAEARRPFANLLDYFGIPVELTGGRVYVRVE